jgi:Phosphotransferase enzyme family
MADLAAVIAAHLAEWNDSPAYVELAIYGTDDPQAIARELDVFCRRELGAGVAAGLFHQSSIGAVTGVVLSDGRRLVIKAHQPERSPAWLAEIVRVQRHLAALRTYATTVCAGPAAIGRGHAVVEVFASGGATRDAHVPAVRRALAAGLHEIVASCRPLVASSMLSGHLLVDLPAGRLWPVPHSRLFDFEATAAGAGWIDDVARAARARMLPAGELVIGHGDWRAEHVRFEGGRATVAFDWDSLCIEREPALVGFTAHAFAADWTRGDSIPQAPTLDEARAFIADYQSARGRAFDDAERRLCGGAFAYACAYTARCGWRAIDDRTRAGTFHHLVARHGTALMEL